LKILAIDTATEGCSAALWINGNVADREVEVERGHSELILKMIDELLSEAGETLKGLDAIAFGRGPGSFTGVRLAASVTQGLAFGAGLPVVGISDLHAVAQRAMVRTADTAPHHVLVCNDARMHEVYWACFARGGEGQAVAAGVERVSRPSEVALPAAWSESSVTGAGRGFAVYPELQVHCGTNILLDVLPGAREIACLAAAEVVAGRVVSPEEAVPVYVRDDVARPKAS
jgi:tRNA threonylcarbamoyladenosine biosynthesis protein TsaB